MVAGVTELLAPEETLSPIAFIALTVNVYVTPFVSPVMMIGDEPPVALKPPILEVTM
jgi:hypothetical protein